MIFFSKIFIIQLNQKLLSEETIESKYKKTGQLQYFP